MCLLSVCEVVKFALLVDDTHSRLLRSDLYALDIIGRLSTSLELIIEDMCRFNGRLCMELSRVRDLEQNVLHDVGRVWLLELERLALFLKSLTNVPQGFSKKSHLEQNVVETPCFRCQDGR